MILGHLWTSVQFIQTFFEWLYSTDPSRLTGCDTQDDGRGTTQWVRVWGATRWCRSNYWKTQGSSVHCAFLVRGARHICSYRTHVSPWKQPDKDTAKSTALILQHYTVMSLAPASNPRLPFTCFFFNSEQLYSATFFTKVFKLLLSYIFISVFVWYLYPFSWL